MRHFIYALCLLGLVAASLHAAQNLAKSTATPDAASATTSKAVPATAVSMGSRRSKPRMAL